MNKRIPTSEFSKKRDDLILQIRWLLNEMNAAIDEIDEGNIVEAIRILKYETEENGWMKLIK